MSGASCSSSPRNWIAAKCAPERSKSSPRNASNVSPVDRIELGTKYNVPQWLPEAYADLFIRRGSPDKRRGGEVRIGDCGEGAEGAKQVQEEWLDSRSHVTQLVKEIFPPPMLPPAGESAHPDGAGNQ
jgi:hypothetical protein